MLLREVIDEYVQKNKMSYRDFAKKSGVSASYLSIIKKNINPSTGEPPVVKIEMLNKIAKAMGTSLHKLCEIVEDMPIDIGSELPKMNAQTDILYISVPGDNIEVNELRKYLHEVIDQLDDKTLMALKNLTLRMNLDK